jgi:hypothetical protein
MKIPTKPFTTDGCSGGMSKSWEYFARFINWFPGIYNGARLNERLPWHDCCVEHDKAYWRGQGTPADRERADRALARCVAKKGHPRLGYLMYLAVQVGGHPIFPTPYRWGYGFKYGEGGYEK